MVDNLLEFIELNFITNHCFPSTLGLKGLFCDGLVGVSQMCRRFLKFAYDVVRVCMGKMYLLLVRGVSRSKT